MNIRDIKQSALECRDNRCQWERERKHDQKEPMWGTYRWDLCVRCGNWRCRIQRSDGSIDSATTSYEWTSDYERAKEFTREDCRKELDRRARVKAQRSTVVRGTRGRPALRVIEGVA